MASYRFCRTDDLALLSQAHEACYRPYVPDLPSLTPADLKRAMRELGLWCSSCLVALEDREPIAVLLAAKRAHETLIWRVGVRADRRRLGHGRHLLRSLSAKLAILGPPRLAAEIPADWVEAAEFLEACDYARTHDYVDAVGNGARTSAIPDALVARVTLEQLADVVDPAAPRCWHRAWATLERCADRIEGLAVASERRIEAWVLFGGPATFDATAGRSEILAFGAVEPAADSPWLGPLLRLAAGQSGSELRVARVHPAEASPAALAAWGLEPRAVWRGYATTALPG